MSDRSNLHIVIGGTLPRALFADFTALIRKYDLRLENDEGEPFFEELIQANAPLDLYGRDLPGGVAPDLENFCTQNKLPYTRFTQSALGAYLGVHAVYRGSDDIAELSAFDDETPGFTIADIKSATSLQALIELHETITFTPPAFAITEPQLDPDTAAYFAQYRAKALARFPLSPVTQSFHDEMLNCLPPAHRRNIPGFFVSEALTENIHAQFVQRGDAYYGAYVDISLPPEHPEGPITIAKIDALLGHPNYTERCNNPLEWYPKD